MARAGVGDINVVCGLKQVTAGIAHSCALRPDKTIGCWGDNDYGQLGHGGNMNSNMPVTVSGLANVQEVAVGIAHSCALLADQTVACWGRKYLGQQGNPIKTSEIGWE